MPPSKESPYLKQEPFGEAGLHEKRIGARSARTPLVSRLRESRHDDHDWLVAIRLLPYHRDEGHAIHAAFRKDQIGHDDVRSKTAEDAQGRRRPGCGSDLEIVVSQEVVRTSRDRRQSH